MGFQLKKQYSKIELPIKDEHEPFWRRMFNLTTEPVWYISNLILNHVIVFYTLSYSVNTDCVEKLDERLDFVMFALDLLYLIDVIANLAVIYIPSLNVQEWNPTYRPLYILFFEVISLCPFRLIQPLVTEKYYNIFCLFTLLRLLRVVRIIYFHFRFGRMLLFYNLRILEYPLELCFCTLVAYCLMCNSTCWGQSKEECAKNCPFLTTILRLLAKLVGYGMRLESVYIEGHMSIYWYYYGGILQYISFLFIVAVTVANMTIALKNASYFSYVYMNMFRSLYLARKNHGVSQRLLDRTHNFFKNGWVNYGGLDTGDEFYELLTPALSSEMMLDVCWPAFKHSNLFRAANISYLRDLSLVMTQTFVMPGDYIYRKGDWKDKLMYLTDGTIDILSEEDGESAIISLGTGTCIGEIGMLFSYPSVNAIRAKTFCEFHVLDKRYFISSYKRYPASWKQIYEKIQHRVDQSKKLHNVFEVLSKRTFTEVRDVDTSTIYWLKHTLHKLMSNSTEMAYRHDFQNIFLVDEIDKRIFERLIFTASYLDMLVIKERVAMDSDPIFVRTKFPFILQPNSVITVVWETVITLLTVVVSFLIPYASFLTDEYIPGYSPFILFITIIFMIDLFLQCSTAVKTSKIRYVTFRSISVARLQSVVFWADIISCLPLELYTPAILRKITPSAQAMMHMNRIIKLWRIRTLFTKWSQMFNVNCLYITCTKMFLSHVYLCYILFTVLMYCEGSKLRFQHYVFDVIQIMTSVSLLHADDEHLFVFYMVAIFIANSLKWIIIARVGALFTLSNLSLLRVQSEASQLVAFITDNNLSEIYVKRLKNNYECNWELDYGRSSNVQPKFMSDLSTVNYGEVVDNVFGAIVKQMVFFRNLPNRSFFDLMKLMKFITRPSNETIIYNGDSLTRIQLFYKGSVDVLDIDGRVVKTLNHPQPINLVEIFFELPAMRTFVTRTTCIFVQIEGADFHHFLLGYPEVLDWISNVKNDLEIEYKRAVNDLKRDQIKGLTPFGIYHYASKKSFYLFGYNMRQDSFAEYDYFIPYDRYYPLDFIRYFLSRVTILPNGDFIYIWEGVRSFLAIFSALVHFINILNEPQYKPLFYSLYIYGLIDIYVRLHVCYYDERGVLIKHPLKTAKHYLTHGFFLDLLALFPILTDMNEDDDLTYFIANIVRLLPLGRYWQFMQTLKFSVIKSENKFLLLMYAPLIIVFVNYIGSFLINMQCDFSKNTTPHPDLEGFSCKDRSFLIASNFDKPISKIKAHLYGMYLASSFLMCYGFRGYIIDSANIRISVSILSFLGQAIITFIIAKTFCIYSVHKTFLTTQQSGMNRLNQFMKSMNVSKRLMKIVVDTYEISWKITKGRTIHNVLIPFSTPLRRDFFFEIYGKNLVQSSAFSNKSEMFYRNLLDNLTYKIIPKGGYLSTINNIEDTTYIIYSGVADILSPDGTRLTKIMEGAMFGNLERKKFVRIQISIIAMSHIEIFAIKSLHFYELLKVFPEILAEYRTLRSIYFTYIPSRQQEIQIAEFLTHEDIAKRSEGIDLCEAYNPRGVKFKIWTFFVMSYTCYLAILIDLYHMASNDFSIKIIILLYISDVLYIIYFLTLDRLAFEDTKGYLITDLMQIKKRIKSYKLKTWLCILSILPFDVIIMSVKMSPSLQDDIYYFTRINRGFRLIHVADYFTSNFDKVNVKFVIFKVSAIICWTTLFIVAYSTILTVIACRYPINLNPPIPRCNEMKHLSTMEKLIQFSSSIFLATHILTVSTTNQFYPHAVPLIIFFMFSFIIGALLNAMIYGQIFALYDDLSISKKIFRRRLDRLFFFMEREDVSISLISHVNKYVQLIWMTTSGEVYPKLLKDAPIYLREAVMNSAFSHLIYNHPVFSNCHPDCLRQIVGRAEVLYFFSDDYIQFKGSIDESMYFIFSGRIAAIGQDTLARDILDVLKAGDSIGIKQGLFRRTAHEHSYRCLKYSIVIRLQLDRWEYLLDFFPASKQGIYDAIKSYDNVN